MRTPRRAAALLGLALVSGGCERPKALEHVAVVSHEFYWAVASTSGGSVHLAPVARIELKNIRDSESYAIQATAAFRIEDPEHSDKAWTAWQQVAGGDHRMAPGETRVVALQSDGSYTSRGSPQAFFQHELFRDASVEVFVKVGSSDWVEVAAGMVPRRIGSEHSALGEP